MNREKELNTPQAGQEGKCSGLCEDHQKQFDFVSLPPRFVLVVVLCALEVLKKCVYVLVALEKQTEGPWLAQ